MVLTVGALFFAACSSSGGGDQTDGGAGRGATFTLSEWKIAAPSRQLSSGSQQITAKNVGGDVHELIIVSAETAAALPTKADGSVDEDKLASTLVGEIADVPARSSKSKTFALKTGTYVAFCNIVDKMGSGEMMGDGEMGSGSGGGTGHGHFALGMSTTFTVD